MYDEGGNCVYGLIDVDATENSYDFSQYFDGYTPAPGKYKFEVVAKGGDTSSTMSDAEYENWVTLAKPSKPEWTINEGVISLEWNAVSYASTYKVNLYKDGELVDVDIVLEPGETTVKMDSYIVDAGVYTADVQALADGASYCIDSEVSELSEVKRIGAVVSGYVKVEDYASDAEQHKGIKVQLVRTENNPETNLPEEKILYGVLTVEGGAFTIPAVKDGAYVLRLSKPGIVKREIDVTITGDTFNVSNAENPIDLMQGDVQGTDDYVDIFDITDMLQYLGQTEGIPGSTYEENKIFDYDLKPNDQGALRIYNDDLGIVIKNFRMTYGAWEIPAQD